MGFFRKSVVVDLIWGPHDVSYMSETFGVFLAKNQQCYFVAILATFLEKTQTSSRHMPNEAEISTEISAGSVQQHMLLKSVAVCARLYM